MQPISYAMELSGLTPAQLAPLISFQTTPDTNGNPVTTIKSWAIPNVPQPDNDAFQAALAAPEPVIKSVLNAAAQAAQAALIAAGIMVNVDPSASTAKNVFASTDTTSLTFLSGALQFSQLNPNALIAWVSNGVTVQLSAPEIQTLATAVYAYVQSTFSTLSTVLGQIQAGTITTNAQVTAAFTPSTSSTAPAKS